MEKLFCIKWNSGRGSMVIDLEKFFPTSKKNLKKLLSIIALDWEHERELKETLKVYFQEKKKDENERLKNENAKQHLEYKQKESDTKQMVTTKKRPNGVPLSADELKAEKENLRNYKTSAGSYLSYYKRNVKEEKQFSEYLTLL